MSSVLPWFINIFVKVIRKLLTTKSRYSVVSMTMQGGIIGLAGHVKEIIIFVTVWTAWFGISNSQGTQNAETVT